MHVCKEENTNFFFLIKESHLLIIPIIATFIRVLPQWLLGKIDIHYKRFFLRA